MTRNTSSFQIKRGSKLSINFKERVIEKEKKICQPMLEGRVIGRGKEKCPPIVKEKEVGSVMHNGFAFYWRLNLEVRLFVEIMLCD